MLSSFGHQTLEKTNESVGQRISAGPIKSKTHHANGSLKNKQPFAGEGYYFWEDNLDAAEWWGSVQYLQYNKGFRIFKIDLLLEYSTGTFFDLVGSRQHLILLNKMIERTKMKVNCVDWKLHNFIAYFRLMESQTKGIFPFKTIRFNDSSTSRNLQNALPLNSWNNRILLNPFYIICVFEKTDLNLGSFKYVK